LPVNLINGTRPELRFFGRKCIGASNLLRRITAQRSLAVKVEAVILCYACDLYSFHLVGLLQTIREVTLRVNRFVQTQLEAGVAMHRAFYSPMALEVPEYRVKLPVFAFDKDEKRIDDGTASLDKADSRARISA